MAEFTMALLIVYAGVGLCVAAAFLLVGLDRIDDSARGVYAFRPLLIPGVMLLWPLVVTRWMTLEFERREVSGAMTGRSNEKADRS
ncbi:MAG: hypothetical protein NW217_06035 [Hyphomicrobiaceae bacterium]|nr:hypothetical protein [Hyphomicrobiaceae bacterium]